MVDRKQGQEPKNKTVPGLNCFTDHQERKRGTMADNTRDTTKDNIPRIEGEVLPGTEEPKVYISAKTGKKYNGDNLKPFNGSVNTLSTREAQERGRKGGQKSGEVRREQAKARRTAQDILKAITEYQMSDDQIQAVIGDEGRAILGDDKAAYSVMLCRMILQGMDGDTKAAQFVRDTIGDTLPTKTEASVEVITADDVQMIENARKALTG